MKKKKEENGKKNVLIILLITLSILFISLLDSYIYLADEQCI